MKQGKRFFIQTFGCRCNQADSDALRESLCRRSFLEAEHVFDADLVVVNSCTVTQRTDQQIRQAVRKANRENPQARIVVTGCYAQRDPTTLAAIPGVSFVIGNGDKERLAAIVDESIDDVAGRIIHTPIDADRDYLMPSISQFGGRTRPFVKLQDGCDARCTYCVIPAVRGRGRSAAPEDVLSEIRSLIDAGYHEIVLTGVHLGAYGRKMDTPESLTGLLRRILRLPGLGRLRLSSIEPMRFSREIVTLAAGNPVFAPHFHIPLQSASNAVLRRMKRPYIAARFLELLDHIRSTLPHAGIGTDVLVGFPGESDADFDATCDVIRYSPLTYAHVFPFSPREGTPAFSMPDHVPAKVKQERARMARELSQAKNLAFRRQFLGTALKGITLAREEQMGESVVLTENYIQAFTPAPFQPPNRLVNIRIDQVEPGWTRGIFEA